MTRRYVGHGTARFGRILLVLGLMVAPVAASAQAAGDRVRVTLPSGEVVGVLTETRSDELVLALDGGGQQTVAREEIRRLELSLGEHRMVRKGAITGAVAGWVSSVVVPAVACWGDPCPSGTTLKMTALAAGWVLAGAGVGALAGTLTWKSRGRRWTAGVRRVWVSEFA